MPGELYLDHSGEAQTLEQAFKRCPFLNSLGETALAEIQSELELYRVAENGTEAVKQTLIEAPAIPLRRHLPPISPNVAKKHNGLDFAAEGYKDPTLLIFDIDPWDEPSLSSFIEPLMTTHSTNIIFEKSLEKDSEIPNPSLLTELAHLETISEPPILHGSPVLREKTNSADVPNTLDSLQLSELYYEQSAPYHGESTAGSLHTTTDEFETPVDLMPSYHAPAPHDIIELTGVDDTETPFVLDASFEPEFTESVEAGERLETFNPFELISPDNVEVADTDSQPLIALENSPLITPEEIVATNLLRTSLEAVLQAATPDELLPITAQYEVVQQTISELLTLTLPEVVAEADAEAPLPEMPAELTVVLMAQCEILLHRLGLPTDEAAVRHLLYIIAPVELTAQLYPPQPVCPIESASPEVKLSSTPTANAAAGRILNSEYQYLTRLGRHILSMPSFRPLYTN